MQPSAVDRGRRPRYAPLALVVPLCCACPSEVTPGAPKSVPDIQASGGKPMPEGYTLAFEGAKGRAEIPYTQIGVELYGGKFVVRLSADSDTLGAPSFNGWFAVGRTPLETVRDLDRRFFEATTFSITNFSDKYFSLQGETGSNQIERADETRVEGTLTVELHEPGETKIVHKIERARFAAYPNPSMGAASIAQYQQLRGS